jgi:hypothetical protein
MMRVTVEIWPGGDHLRPRRMATIEIANVSELAEESDYATVAVLNPGQPDQRTIRDRVKSHRRSLGWGTLVKRVIETLEAQTRWGMLSERTGDDG